MQTSFRIFLFVILLVSSESVLNCTIGESICRQGCNESPTMKYSGTFCEAKSGTCICDCRDRPAENCTRDPDSDCNLGCEAKNPNPEVFTYSGTTCPISGNKNGSVCVCICSLNTDYEETNEI